MVHCLGKWLAFAGEVLVGIKFSGNDRAKIFNMLPSGLDTVLRSVFSPFHLVDPVIYLDSRALEPLNLDRIWTPCMPSSVINLMT
jgi:hypothetical protein